MRLQAAHQRTRCSCWLYGRDSGVRELSRIRQQHPYSFFADWPACGLNLPNDSRRRKQQPDSQRRLGRSVSQLRPRRRHQLLQLAGRRWPCRRRRQRQLQRLNDRSRCECQCAAMQRAGWRPRCSIERRRFALHVHGRWRHILHRRGARRAALYQLDQHWRARVCGLVVQRGCSPSCRRGTCGQGAYGQRHELCSRRASPAPPSRSRR